MRYRFYNGMEYRTRPKTKHIEKENALIKPIHFFFTVAQKRATLTANAIDLQKEARS